MKFKDGMPLSGAIILCGIISLSAFSFAASPALVDDKAQVGPTTPLTGPIQTLGASTPTTSNLTTTTTDAIPSTPSLATIFLQRFQSTIKKPAVPAVTPAVAPAITPAVTPANVTPVAPSAATSTTIFMPGGVITLLSPNPSKVLSGIVPLQVHAERPLTAAEVQLNISKHEAAQKSIEGLYFFMDGKQMPSFSWGAGYQNTNYNLDTTLMANGVHNLRVLATSYPYTTGPAPVAELFATFNVDNGRVLSQVRPKWSALHMQPREKTSLSPVQFYTDGSYESLASGTSGITYVSSNPDVAIVDSDGSVTALKLGMSIITLQDSQGKSAMTQVWVDDPTRGFPHFGKDGSFLTQYDPQKSIFVRSVFKSSSFLLDPTLMAKAKAAFMNTIESGFYRNPADSTASTLATLEGNLGQWVGEYVNVANANGVSILATGDDLDRTPAELLNTATNPWAPTAITFALQKLIAGHCCIGIAMMDECDNPWGPTPRPTTQWPFSGLNQVPLSAWANLDQLLRNVPNHPGLAFPNISLSPVGNVKAWQGDQTFADFGILYWSYFDTEPAYDTRRSLASAVKWIDYRSQLCLPVMQRNKPVLLLTQMGKGTGTSNPGCAPLDTAGQIMFAAIRGFAGTRAYDVNEAPPENWDAMSAAYHLISLIEPLLLQPEVNAIHLGDDIPTGAHQGSNGSVFLAMNTLDTPQTVTVNLSPYSNGASQIKRYRLVGNQLQEASVANVTMDTVTFAGNETIVWAFGH